jgi:hypothetical protein
VRGGQKRIKKEFTAELAEGHGGNGELGWVGKAFSERGHGECRVWMREEGGREGKALRAGELEEKGL